MYFLIFFKKRAFIRCVTISILQYHMFLIVLHRGDWHLEKVIFFLNLRAIFLSFFSDNMYKPSINRQQIYTWPKGWWALTGVLSYTYIFIPKSRSGEMKTMATPLGWQNGFMGFRVLLSSGTLGRGILILGDLT